MPQNRKIFLRSLDIVIPRLSFFELAYFETVGFKKNSHRRNPPFDLGYFDD